MATNRRSFLKGIPVAAAGLALPATVQAAVETSEYFFAGDVVMVARLERGGSLSLFEGAVSGRVERPRNYARHYREMFGYWPWDNPKHIMNTSGDEWPKSHDVADYDQSHPVMALRYFDEARPDVIVYLNHVAHLDDAGSGLHRWFSVNEPAHTNWRWDLGSISPESTYAAIDRDPDMRRLLE